MYGTFRSYFVLDFYHSGSSWFKNGVNKTLIFYVLRIRPSDLFGFKSNKLKTKCKSKSKSR
jgi:hypothetical protein